MFLNKWPRVNSDECLFKYLKFIENNEYLIKNKNNKIFGVIQKKNTTSYLYSDQYFVFCKKKFFTINYFFFKFNTVCEIRKKNYILRENFFLPYPFFNLIEKTNLFVNLIIIIDSLHKVDQLNLERFESIFTILLSKSELFEPNEMKQFHFLTFLIAYTTQRPIANIENFIENQTQSHIKDNFFLFKCSLKNFNEITHVRTYFENNEFTNRDTSKDINLKLIFGNEIFICNEKTNFEYYEQFYSNIIDKYLESKVLIYMCDFKFIQGQKIINGIQEIVNLKNLNEENYFIIVCCVNNKIKLFTLKFCFLNEIKFSNNMSEMILSATKVCNKTQVKHLKKDNLKQVNKNNFSSMKAFFDLPEVFAQDMFLIFEILSINHIKLNSIKTKIIHYEKQKINLCLLVNFELLYFYIKLHLHNNTVKLANKSWLHDLSKCRIKDLISFVMFNYSVENNKIFANIIFKESCRLKKTNLSKNMLFNFDLNSNLSTSNFY
jgi:hypothetical protein